jgi:uncharacterized protein YndB with AHSA1/START domain
MAKQTVHVEHDFTLPPERIYGYLAEHENLAVLFGLRVERASDGTDSRNGAGSSRKMSFFGLLPFVETVTKAVPNELIEYRITKGSPLRDHSGRMVFTPTASGGTHLVYVIEFGAAVPGLAPVVKAGLTSSIARGLKKIDGLA